MTLLMEEHDKQNNEAMQLLKHQFNQESSLLKEQLIQN